MKLDHATEKDSPALSEFHREFIQTGVVDFKVDRAQDYFAPYRTHSDQFRTYILRDEKQVIQAAASFVLRDVMTEGVLQKIAYATDLRVAPNRRAMLQWSQHFLPVMKELRDELNVEHFFSVLSQAESTGANLFLRPRTMKRPLPRYFLYRRFHLTSLHGRFPWAHRPLRMFASGEETPPTPTLYSITS